MQPKTLAVAALISFLIPTSVVAKTATQNNPNKIWMLSSIAQQYAEVGQKQKASELITQALPLVDNISSNCDKPKPMATIAGNYARVGQDAQAKLLLEQAIKIAKTAKGCNSTNDSVENLLDISNKYIDEGLYDLALQSVKGLDDASLFYQVYGLSLIARDFAQSKKVDQVNALTTEILNVAQSIKDVNQRAFALSRGAYEFIEARQNTQAIKLLTEAQKTIPAIKDVDGKPDTLLLIARGYIKLRQPTEAIKILEQAILAAQKVSNLSFRVHNLGAIAVEYAAVNQKPKANLLLQQALSTANKIKPGSQRDDLLLTVSNYSAKSGQYDQAIKIANSINNNRQNQAAALSRIAAEVARQGKFDLALQIAQRQISDAGHKAGALMQIARALVNTKQLDRAVTVAQSIKGKYEKVGVLSEIALQYAENGNPDKAMNLVNTINKLSASLSDEGNDIDWMLPVVAQSYAKAGNFDRAIKVAESIKITQHRVQALTQIANEYSAKGQKDNSLLLLAQAFQLVK